MEHEVCLDTDVVIDILNKRERVKALLEKLENSTITISSITLFEVLQRKTNLEAIEAFRSDVDVLDVNEVVARTASIILKQIRHEGKMIDFRDLFIAASCLAHKKTLATFNTKHYQHVSGLTMVSA